MRRASQADGLPCPGGAGGTVVPDNASTSEGLLAVAAHADRAEPPGAVEVVVHEAGDADHVAGLERAAGEVAVVLERAELGGELHGHVPVVHDEELDLDRLLDVLMEGPVERDDRVPAAQGGPMAE